MVQTQTEPAMKPVRVDKVFDIMVVDDTPANLQVLMELLKNSGYKVRPIPKGKLALQAAKNSPPDLILLDINMPEMNGYEVCEKLKADPLLAEIPVIFISALDETQDKVKAFERGGVDYITKPFQFQEVLARVQTHLKLNQLQQEMGQKNLILSHQLQELQRLEGLRDSLVHMIVHDLRSPLAGIVGYLSLMEMFEDQIPEQIKGYLRKSSNNTTVLMDMINNLLDLHRFECDDFPLNVEPVNLSELLTEGLDVLGATLEDIELEKKLLDPAPTVLLDRQLIRRVISNLVSNAVKFNPPDAPLLIEMAYEDEQVLISIEDRGRGIPEAYQQTIFDKFVQVEARENKQHFSSGLGLSFCQLAVKAHGGEIRLKSTVGEGSRFTIVLPHKQE